MNIRTLALTLSMGALLAACGVDTTGISAESSRTPLGGENAAVVVAEYADLQCPACKAAHSLLTKPLVAKYGNRIRFDFKHFPLRTIHPYALEAAEAAECAADQGKFWEYLDYNYEHQDDLNKKPYEDWAKALGLNEDTFHRCLASHIKRDVVMADANEANALGFNSTPTYAVDGVKVTANTLEAISAAVDQALAKAQAVPL